MEEGRMQTGISNLSSGKQLRHRQLYIKVEVEDGMMLSISQVLLEDKISTGRQS
jgi:hypothetical protein